jgi:hypothetical protein
MFTSEYRVGHGTFLYFGAEIKPALVIDELVLSVRFKSRQPGPQLMARVVLPRDIDPQTKAPFSFLVSGDTYAGDGIERVLHLANIPQQMEARLRVLRIERQQPIDGREAFIDRVMINAYGVPGDNQISMGTPKAAGVAEPTDEGAVREIGIQRLEDVSEAISVRVDGDVIRVGEQPIFVRAMDDRGEDWGLLKRLGFNTVRLLRGPTADDIGRAETLGIYLIAPLPSEAEWQHIRHYGHSIVAWELSGGENWEGAPQVPVNGARSPRNISRKYLSEMQSNPQWSRPILGPDFANGAGLRPNILLRKGSFPQVVNSPISGFFPATHRGLTAQWELISTEPSAVVLKQLRELGYRGSEISFDPEEIEEQIIAGIQDGSRGLCVTSETPVLGGQTSETSRSLALECLLAKLDFAEPWIVAGRAPVDIPCSTPNGRAVAFAKNQGTLIVFRNRMIREASEPFSDQDPSFRLTLSGCTPDMLAFRVSTAGLEPLTVSEGAGGIHVEVDNPGQTEFILATNDPNLVIMAAKKCAEKGLENIQRALKLATLLAEETANVVRSVPAITSVARECGLRLESVYGELGRCRHAIDQRNWFEAESHLRGVSRKVHQTRRALLRAVAGFEPGAEGNPLLSHIASMPTAWQLLPRWHRSSWKQLSAASNEFDSVSSLLGIGWKAYDTKLPGRSSRVTIQKRSNGNGSGCLALVARREAPNPQGVRQVGFEMDGYKLPAAWIQSAIVDVPGDHILRVAGQVLVADDNDDEPARLIVSDSLGNSDLAMAIAPSSTWRPFVIYRGVDGRVPFRLTIALAGTGEALLDEISTSISPRVDLDQRMSVQPVSHRK